MHIPYLPYVFFSLKKLNQEFQVVYCPTFIFIPQLEYLPLGVEINPSEHLIISVFYLACSLKMVQKQVPGRSINLELVFISYVMDDVIMSCISLCILFTLISACIFIGNTHTIHLHIILVGARLITNERWWSPTTTTAARYKRHSSSRPFCISCISL